MKKYIKYLFLLVAFSGCEEVIDKNMLDAVDNTEVWDDPAMVKLYVNNLYNRTIPGFSGGANAGVSDETMGTGPDNMMYGMLPTTSGLGNYIGKHGYSVDTYGVIRKINILLEEIQGTGLSESERNLAVGQALMMRAWIYWEMIKLYGGVPMIMEVQDANAPGGLQALYKERDPAAKSVELIVKDLDEAIAKLPITWPASEFGRFTKAAAAALKGRVLLYYASPQFNPDNEASRWTAAYEANKQAKQLAQEAGHALHPNFDRVFLDEANKEAILVTVFDATKKSHGFEQSVRPASTKNPPTGSSSTPTWDFVKAFPMADGQSIEGNPQYDQTFFWKNRDPRFYATVAYNGALYDLPGDQLYNGTGKPRRQWTYLNNIQEKNFTTNTGFYLRKMVNKNIPQSTTNFTPTDWIEIRYAEVLLNLAEAANEVGATEEAYTELKAIRKRAGILEGDGNYGLAQGMSKDAMRDAVMLERQIELAFENKRHWDLRRRNLFENKLNGTTRTGIVTTLNYETLIPMMPPIPNNPNPTQAQKEAAAKAYFESNILVNSDPNFWNDESNYTKYFKTTFNNNLELEGRVINFLQPKYNFYFIPQDPINKDPKTKQTIRWENGTFDPLQQQ